MPTKLASLSVSRSSTLFVTVAIITALAAAFALGRTWNSEQPLQVASTEGSSGGGSIARVPDVDRLVDEAPVIVYGEVLATYEIIPLHEYGADFIMSIDVRKAYKGSPADTLQVLRGGLMPGNDVQREPDMLAGPLTPGPSVLFLQPSAMDGVFQVMGHTQGEMPVRDGKITKGRGPSALPDFVGMSLQAFEDHIAARTRS